jgi:hypothetical protein
MLEISNFLNTNRRRVFHFIKEILEYFFFVSQDIDFIVSAKGKFKFEMAILVPRKSINLVLICLFYNLNCSFLISNHRFCNTII